MQNGANICWQAAFLHVPDNFLGTQIRAEDKLEDGMCDYGFLQKHPGPPHASLHHLLFLVSSIASLHIFLNGMCGRKKVSKETAKVREIACRRKERITRKTDRMADRRKQRVTRKKTERSSGSPGK